MVVPLQKYPSYLHGIGISVKLRRCSAVQNFDYEIWVVLKLMNLNMNHWLPKAICTGNNEIE